MLKTPDNKKNYLYFTALLLLSLFFIYYQFISTTSANDGIFVYNHDDAYIHMAIAENLADYGVWGVNKEEFSSSSSSLLWTLSVAALFKLTGNNDAVPLLINMFLTVILVLILFKMFCFWNVKPLFSAVGATLIVLLAPSGFLIFSGLEHLLHIIITLIFMYSWSEILAGRSENIRFDIKTAIVTVLLPMVRFEGLFAVAAVILILVLKKRWKVAGLYLGTAILPIAIYGLISINNGWFLLPNSVYLKGSTPAVSLAGLIDFVYAGLKQLLYNIHILTGLVGVVVLLIVRKGERNALEMYGYMTVLIVSMHMFFAKSGYFTNMLFRTRYDSYLIVMVLFFIVVAVADLIKTHSGGNDLKTLAGYLLLILLIILPAGERALWIQKRTARASVNVFMQQYQMGLFLKKFYREQPVAVNDIGLPSYLGKIYTIDLLGLANMDVGRSFKNGTYSSATVEKIVADNKCRIAIVFDSLFRLTGSSDRIPAAWLKAGVWRIPGNVICASDTVSFYAMDEESLSTLKSNLKIFADTLPKAVVWKVFESGK